MPSKSWALAAAPAKSLQSCPTLCDPIDSTSTQYLFKDTDEWVNEWMRESRSPGFSAPTPGFPEGRHMHGGICFQPCPFSTRNHISRFISRPCNPSPQGEKGQTAPVLQRIAPWRHMTISFTPEKGKSYGWLLSLLQVGTSTHHHLLFLFLKWIFYFISYVFILILTMLCIHYSTRAFSSSSAWA